MRSCCANAWHERWNRTAAARAPCPKWHRRRARFAWRCPPGNWSETPCRPRRPAKNGRCRATRISSCSPLAPLDGNLAAGAAPVPLGPRKRVHSWAGKAAARREQGRQPTAESQRPAAQSGTHGRISWWARIAGGFIHRLSGRPPTAVGRFMLSDALAGCQQVTDRGGDWMKRQKLGDLGLVDKDHIERLNLRVPQQEPMPNTS